jgi:hypothetical protein
VESITIFGQPMFENVMWFEVVINPPSNSAKFGYLKNMEGTF